MTREEYKQLLILNMKRCIEIMENEKPNHFYDKQRAELKRKLHEVRRDSVALYGRDSL